MNKILGALITSSLLIPGAAYAQRDDDHRQPPLEQQQRDGRDGPQQNRSETRGPDDRQQGDRRDAPPPQARPGASHPFAKGARFARSRAPHYRRIDYREFRRLSPPPRGYVWVRAGDDALLVRLSNNVVVQIVANIF